MDSGFDQNKLSHTMETGKEEKRKNCWIDPDIGMCRMGRSASVPHQQ